MNANEKETPSSSFGTPRPGKDSPRIEPTAFPVLYTKLHKPLLGEDIIIRTALIERLEKGLQKPLTLVSAAAGYGKSVTVSQWLNQTKVKNCWVSLDEEHNELRIFLAYLVTAIGQVIPGSLSRTRDLLEGAELPPFEVITHTLINELDQLEAPFILVLDDYHMIQKEPIHRLMNELLRYPPELLHLVLITRRDPPLQLTRLRMQNRLTEIRMAELSFRSEEVDTLMRQIKGSVLSKEETETLMVKTEGWITGLRLALMGLASGLPMEDILAHLRSDLSHVSSYLLEEVILKQPEAVQRGLAATAVLDRFCPELVATLHADSPAPAAESKGEHSFVQALLRSNLFIIPLDQQLEWFRYHHLFQEFLRKKLEKTHRPETIAAFHKRASNWFEAHDLLEEALQHAVKSGDIAFAGDLFNRHRHHLLDTEQFQRLGRWLDFFPDHWIEQHTGLLLARAYVADTRGDFQAEQGYLEQAQALIASTVIEPDARRRLEGEWNCLSAVVAFWNGHVSLTMELSQKALELLPAKPGFLRHYAFAFRAMALQATGAGTEGLAILEEGFLQLPEGDDISKYHFLIIRCWILGLRTDLPALARTALQVQGPSLPRKYYTTWSIATYYLGLARYLRNELEDVGGYLEPMLQHRYVVHAFWVLQSFFTAAFAWQARKKETELTRLIHEIHDWCEDYNNEIMTHLVRAFEVELALRREDLSGAREWSKETNFDILPPLFFYFTPQLTRIKLWMHTGTPVQVKEAEDQLEKMVSFSRSTFNYNLLIQALALQSMLHAQTGNSGRALESLREALAMGEPGGHIRTFADLGRPMEALIKKLSCNRPGHSYLRTLLGAFEKDRQIESSPPAGEQHLTLPAGQETLSDRELEILQLVAEGYRNTEIAEQLFLSLNTVKGHLYHLYQKLDVKNRINAVAKARELGVIKAD